MLDVDMARFPSSAHHWQRLNLRSIATAPRKGREQCLTRVATKVMNHTLVCMKGGPVLQPVAGDWRSKVKAARKAAKSESSDKDTTPAAAAEAAPETSKRDKSSQISKKAAAANGKASKASRPDLEALARGLPAGWRPMYDKASSSVYYGNLSTKVAPELSLAWGCHRPHNSRHSDLVTLSGCTHGFKAVSSRTINAWGWMRL